MLHILFWILKIIGIILLSLLGLALCMVSIILFVPVKYRVDIEGKTIQAKAHWLLHLLSAYFTYDGIKSDWQIRVVWKKLRDKEEADSETEVETEVETAFSTEHKTQTHEESVHEDCIQKSVKAENRKPKKKLFSKFKCTIRNICDKIKMLWETKEKLAKFITDPVHQEAFRRIKKEIVILAKRIRPRKLEGFVHFGTEDPYNTGRILAGLSVLYPFYGKRIRIYPDFENKVLEGEIHMRGHMHVVTFLALLWNLFLDKNVKATYRDYKKLRP